MVLIDAIYIHNSGGKSLLKFLIDSITKFNPNNFWYLLDNRLDNELIGTIAAREKTSIYASEFSRKKFYKENQDKFKSIFCFGNVPPPISINQRVVIYFQNDLILSSKKTNIGIKSALLLALKRMYISYKNKKKYYWIVQTTLMKEKLVDTLAIEKDKVEVYPFFEDLSKPGKNPPEKNSFLYVAGPGVHKNHKRLLTSFNKAANESKTSLSLKLTLPNEAFSSLKQLLPNPSQNLKLTNLGVLTKEEVLKNYQKTRFCIYPSLKESFGLPLIEAAQLGLEIIASDLPYVHEVVSPLLCFNPYEEEDIAAIILKAVNLGKTNKTVLKISNKVEALINFISNDI